MDTIIEVNGKKFYCVKKFDKAIIPNEVVVTFDLARLELFKGSGEIQLKFNEWQKPSYLFFTYYDDELVIEEIRAQIQRIGHGRIMLEFLVELIQNYNDTVEDYNKSTERIKYNKIKKVTGTMRGDDGRISHEELKIFYDKCGFLKNNSLLKEIE